MVRGKKEKDLVGSLKAAVVRGTRWDGFMVVWLAHEEAVYALSL